jgi:hypothetical protein
MILWNINSRNQSNSDSKVIKVFLGGANGVQVNPFKAAWTRLQFSKENWIIQYISVVYINESGWTPKHFVDWLLDSDIHFILSHVHQGIAKYLQWNMEDLQCQLQRLKFHLGFPNLKKLECPVFTQDKYKYLSSMPMHKVNNTLKLILTDDKSYYSRTNEEFIIALKRFILFKLSIFY